MEGEIEIFRGKDETMTLPRAGFYIWVRHLGRWWQVEDEREGINLELAERVIFLLDQPGILNI